MKELNRIHLGGLRAIEAVGRLGSLRAAADALGVTPGAVSQQIQKTEQQLGRTLFDRRPKGLTLTAHGEDVVQHLTRGLSELAAAVALAGRKREDTLTVSCAPVFAGKWLVWRLKDFNKHHPDIRVRVDANANLVDPDLSDVDVGIRVGRGPYTDVSAEKLLDLRVFPVCSPALAEQVSSPHDLSRVPIIRDDNDVYGWNCWLEPNGCDDSMLADGPSFSDASLCFDAAIAGQGVFLAWDVLAFDALQAGRVVAPLPGRHRNGATYWFVTGRRTRKSKSVHAFETWLREQLDAVVKSD